MFLLNQLNFVYNNVYFQSPLKKFKGFENMRMANTQLLKKVRYKMVSGVLLISHRHNQKIKPLNKQILVKGKEETVLAIIGIYHSKSAT